MIHLSLQNGELKTTGKNIPIFGEYDAVVTGGGVAGCAAAMACGKRGLKTLIIEATAALGGLATMGLVNIPLDFVSGLGTEMFDLLKEANGIWHRNTDPEKHKLILDRMLKNYHCDILLATLVIDSIVEGHKIRGVVIQTKTGPQAVLAKMVIDASGDSDAAYFAGAETVQGRESDGMSQACSLEFVLGGVDWNKYMASDVKQLDPKWIDLIARDLKTGELAFEVDNHLNWITHIPGRPQNCGMDEVSICLAHSRNCFPCDNRDLSRMYLEGREQADMLSKYIKKRVPGFENSYLIQTGSLMGVRESRRVVGEYVLTAEDLASLAKYDDVITISTHGYDIHNYAGPGNIKWAEMQINGKTEYVICNHSGFGHTTPPPNGKQVVNYKGQSSEDAEFEVNGYYDIPYRCLVPIEMDNLLVAGRNLSADIYAQSGTRLIMACLTMGEAAGTAAAMALAEGIAPRQVNVTRLQTELIENGVNLGQGYRMISGVEKYCKGYEDKYNNPELYKEGTKIEVTQLAAITDV